MAETTTTTEQPRLEAYQVILGPLVTEKGTHQSTHQHHNAYSFQVNLWANKTQIKAAVEELFNVRVEKVRTQLRLGKKRRYRFKHPTASGKTVAAAGFVEACRTVGVLILTHRRLLLDPWSAIRTVEIALGW